MIGIPFSLLAVAAGAILAYAVNRNVHGVDLYLAGWILIVVGLIGAVLSLVIWESRHRPPVPPGARRRF